MFYTAIKTIAAKMHRKDLSTRLICNRALNFHRKQSSNDFKRLVENMANAWMRNIYTQGMITLMEVNPPGGPTQKEKDCT
jgi:hypothetical protein